MASSLSQRLCSPSDGEARLSHVGFHHGDTEVTEKGRLARLAHLPRSYPYQLPLSPRKRYGMHTSCSNALPNNRLARESGHPGPANAVSGALPLGPRFRGDSGISNGRRSVFRMCVHAVARKRGPRVTGVHP